MMNKERVNVLLIDETPDDIQSIRKFITDINNTDNTDTPYFHLLPAQNINVALAYLTEMSFDIVLFQLSQSANNLEIFNHIQNSAPQLPCIIIGSASDAAVAAQMVQSGAHDYLINNHITALTLARSLRAALERQHLLSQLKEKTEALDISEKGRRLIIEKNVDGVIIVNQDGIIRFANQAAGQIFLRDYLELLGQSFDLPQPVDPTSKIQRTIDREDQSQIITELHFIEINWDGEESYLVCMRDITDHEQTKDQLSHQAAELEKRNLELDAFAHTMAHQIQGLLGHMIGYASYLEMQYGPQMDEEGQNVLYRILRSGNKMSNVVNELLLLAYVDKENVPLVTLNMALIVNEALKRMEFIVEEYQAQFIIADNWPDAVGYPSWIEEAWVNYVSNALKYGGHPPLIELGWQKSGNEMIRFWVKDNGEGISAAEQKKLFKRHSRLLKTEVKGEGLGLYIVQRIIHKCGGEVGVESSPGQGSLFWFSLPGKRADSDISAEL